MINLVWATDVPVKVTTLTSGGSIDFSVLDTVMGAIAGAVIVVVLGYFLMRLGLVKFVTDKNSSGQTSDIMILHFDQLKELISGLRTDVEKYVAEHLECQRTLVDKFPSLKMFEKLEKDRAKRWDQYFFPHTHYPEESDGGVKIPRNLKIEEG